MNYWMNFLTMMEKIITIMLTGVQTLGIVLPPLYNLNLVTVEVGILLAVIFYALLAGSGILILILGPLSDSWRVSRG
jgi:uncharacterized MnhB-related membrane protein